MANDIVRNQKVFVTLGGYTALVEEYRRVKSASDNTACNLALAANDMNGYNAMVARRQAMEFVFKTLGLPINI